MIRSSSHKISYKSVHGLWSIYDHYGRKVPKGAHGSTRFDNSTNLGSVIITEATALFDKIADKSLTVRRITICANRVTADTGTYQFSLFDDAENVEKMEKEKKLQKALVGLKKRYGKNSILKGTNYLEGATMRERNQQIGGHKS